MTMTILSFADVVIEALDDLDLETDLGEFNLDFWLSSFDDELKITLTPKTPSPPKATIFHIGDFVFDVQNPKGVLVISKMWDDGKFEVCPWNGYRYSVPPDRLTPIKSDTFLSDKIKKVREIILSPEKKPPTPPSSPPTPAPTPPPMAPIWGGPRPIEPTPPSTPPPAPVVPPATPPSPAPPIGPLSDILRHLPYGKVFTHDVHKEAMDRLLIKLNQVAPYVSAGYSTLGGEDRSAIIVAISLDKRDNWTNGIMENSRYLKAIIEQDGTVESRSGSIEFRKISRPYPTNIDTVAEKIIVYLKRELEPKSPQVSKMSIINAIEAWAKREKDEMIAEHPTIADGYKFGYEDRGVNYYKLFRDSHGQKSVVMFVDKLTGDVYYPAGWKGPAKGIRGNILTGTKWKTEGKATMWV